MLDLVDVELHPSFKKCIKSFCMHKNLTFFLHFSFLYLINSLGGYNKNEIHPGDHDSNLDKVGAIPSEPSMLS